MRLLSAFATALLLAACAGSSFGGSLPPNSSAADALVGFQSAGGPPVVAGCQVFPAASGTPSGQAWWNVDISSYPKFQYSDQIIKEYGGENLHPDFGHEAYYGIPFNVVPANQPKVPIAFFSYASQSNKGPYPIPAHPEIEGMPRYPGGDTHMLILQQGSCELYETWHTRQPGYKGHQGWSAANGATFDLNSTALRPNGWTSADAAGLPIFPALIKCDEVAAGTINHALRVTFNNTRTGYIHPATHATGEYNDYYNWPPMGLRLRLNASYPITKFNRVSQIILTAMKKYGLFVADNGSDWYFQGQGGKEAKCWNDNQLDQLKNVPGSAFEAVDTGPVLDIGL